MPETVSKTLNQLINTLLSIFDTTQLVMLVIVFLAAWVLQFPVRRLLKRIEQNLPEADWSRTIMLMLRRLAFPFTALLLGNLAVEVFSRLDYKVDLLELINQLVLIWLLYRVVTALVDTNLTSKKARFWSNKVLLPSALIIGLLSALGLLQPILNWGIYIEPIDWQLTIGAMLFAIGIIVAFYFLARWTKKSLASSFLPKAGIDSSLANTVSIISAYVIITIGVLVALGSIGINLSTLTVVLGGLSVGIAFGLQEIVNNFVSGFIILFERSIEPGDVVDVDGHIGTVQTVGIRSTIIKTRDNVELIIPNSKFLTEVVTNMTHSEDLVRIRVNVGVSYKASPREVEQALLKVARQHSDILAEPAPSVQFKDFGDSSLNFELLVWTEQAIQTPVLTSDLRFDIWDALAARNIEIPFPQRDIHIRSGIPWSDLTQERNNPQQ